MFNYTPGARGNEGNPSLKPAERDENGLKYATPAFNAHKKNHNDAWAKNEGSTWGFMHELPGKPLCPASPLEEYVSHLPPDVPTLLSPPKKKKSCLSVPFTWCLVSKINSWSFFGGGYNEIRTATKNAHDMLQVHSRDNGCQTPFKNVAKNMQASRNVTEIHKPLHLH